MEEGQRGACEVTGDSGRTSLALQGKPGRGARYKTEAFKTQLSKWDIIMSPNCIPAMESLGLGQG